MKLAILGGSFNPVHIGHLFLADAILSQLGYGRVILIPAFESPFKLGAAKASPADRLAMLAASIAGDPRLTIDDCEIKREGVSYTADTVADVIRRYGPEGKPGLILGDDLAADFHKWHKADEIAAQADIIIARRLFNSNAEKGGTSACSGLNSPFPYPFKNLQNEVMNVSSRLVREKISSGGDWRYLVPAGARYIIEERGLYGLPAKPLAELTARIENAARLALSPARFLHSRNTALLARDLCLRFGADPAKGYLAGVAHDICKSLKEDELVKLAKKDGGGFTKLDRKKPSLLHGRAAAVFLRERWGVTDPEILDAVRFHTEGSRTMGTLAKIVYSADKMEVSREKTDPALRELLERGSLDDLFAAVLGGAVAYLKENRLDISFSTKKLLAAMSAEKNEKKK